MSEYTFPESPLEFAMFDWIEDSGQPVADIVEHKMQLVETADQGGLYRAGAVGRGGWRQPSSPGRHARHSVGPPPQRASKLETKMELYRIGAPRRPPHGWINGVAVPRSGLH